jgi:beta-phosphoglucomutase
MQKKHERPAAIIFDVDGVLVDSNPFHLQKWAEFLKEHGVPFNPDDLPNNILGQRNDAIIRFFFGQEVSDRDILRLGEEVEERFRQVFRPHAKPLPGLSSLIASCHRAAIPMAVASSAMAKNVEFIVEVLGFRSHFRCLVTGDQVTHPKPHPEIYLKTAERLGIDPAWCVTFEDSFVGVESAKGAGMKCVAIASTFPLEELRERTRADLIVRSFEDLTLDALRQLFEDNR